MRLRVVILVHVAVATQAFVAPYAAPPRWQQQQPARRALEKPAISERRDVVGEHRTRLAAAPGPGGELPRPDPRFDPLAKLFLCLAIDLLGACSYAIPGLGEGFDVGWAPVQAALVNYLFGNGIVTGFAFIEEILPGTDFIPTATIAWFYENRDTAPPTDPGRQRPEPASPPRRSGTLREGAIDV